VGELPQQAVLALGFGPDTESAATLARTALSEPFSASWERQLMAWTRWHARAGPEESLAQQLPEECAAQVHVSTKVLWSHQDNSIPVPWWPA
jgi:glucoamylase